AFLHFISWVKIWLLWQLSCEHHQQIMYKNEGESVTMECKFSVSYTYYMMYWYRQPSSGEMIYMINIYSQSKHAKEGRYSVEFYKPNQMLKLTISALTLSDSAVYFCAIREFHSEGRRKVGALLRFLESPQALCETDKLIFGKGTRLIVEPKSQATASPSVFVMKNGTNVACLVKEFYPKDLTINLQSSKKIIEYDPAIVISPGGKYSAVKLGQYEDSDSVTCSVEHNKKIWHSTDFEPKKNISETLKPKESENRTKREAPVTCYEPQVQPGKVNMMSLSVLGLRMLFAKSVAVNFLLTAKLFFF
uniref:Ig-like domain-containing protein n=1 Tax=Moschus moschiferus TaxID=68415 RepID=A0A8C6FGL3_MOSMO